MPCFQKVSEAVKRFLFFVFVILALMEGCEKAKPQAENTAPVASPPVSYRQVTIIDENGPRTVTVPVGQELVPAAPVGPLVAPVVPAPKRWKE